MSEALSPPKTAVFFDIGGVLLTNGWDTSQRATVLAELGVELGPYEARHDDANFYWERGLQSARWFFDQTLFYKDRPFTFEQLWPRVEAQSRVLYPEVYDILRDLRRTGLYRVATLNNESRELNEYRVQAFDLRSYFDFFICSGYVREMKPLLGIYQTAVEVAGVPARNTVFIDDKQENCQAAHDLGMQAIRFQSPEQLRAALTGIGITL